MEPLYKAGDKVIVKVREFDESDYKFTFTNDMNKLQGKIFTIESVRPNAYGRRLMTEDDCAAYRFKEDTRFTWASSMFEPANSNEHNLKRRIRKILYASLIEAGIEIG